MIALMHLANTNTKINYKINEYQKVNVKNASNYNNNGNNSNTGIAYQSLQLVKLVTLVQDDPKAPFSIATIPR